MSSKMEICNKAILRVGLNPIESIDDKLKEAKYCKAIYESAKEVVLREPDCDWNCARKKAFLPLVNTGYSLDYQYAFTLPIDCVKAIKLYGADSETGAILRLLDWIISENKLILANSMVVNLEYTAMQSDDTLLDALFADALSYKLAIELATGVKADFTLAKNFIELYERTIAKARIANAKEGNPAEIPFVSDLINSRL